MRSRTNALRALAAACAAACALAVPCLASAEEERGIGAKVSSAGALEHGETFTFAGRLGTGPRTVAAKPSRVAIEFRRAGSRRFTRIKTVEPARDGTFRARVRARVNGAVRAVAPEGTASAARKVRVSAVLTLEKPQPDVYLGGKVGLRGKVRPGGHRDVKVVIGGPDGRVIRTGTDRHGNFRAGWRPGSAGDHRVRVFAAKNRLAGGDDSARKPVSVFRPTHASYYGPGLYGNGVACGGTLLPSTLGVAHKTLPCGTKVTIRYGKREVTVPVIDRGPYVAGREWDLTEATRDRLRFGGVGTVWVNR